MVAEAVETALIPCVICRVRMRRPADREADKRHPLIYTRTAVGDRLVPTCSKKCAETLRASKSYWNDSLDNLLPLTADQLEATALRVERSILALGPTVNRAECDVFQLARAVLSGRVSQPTRSSDGDSNEEEAGQEEGSTANPPDYSSDADS